MSASEQLNLDIWSVDSPKARPGHQAESIYSKSIPEASDGSGNSRSQAGINLARAALGLSPPQIESSDLPPKKPIKRFEKLVVERIGHFLYDSPQKPLFSLDELELLIRNQNSYFSSVRGNVKPSSAEGDDLSVRQGRAEAKARKGRAKVYAEQLVSSLVSVDNCRSWRWYLINGDFSPVRPEDSPEGIQRRVAVDLADLLAAARRRRLIGWWPQ